MSDSLREQILRDRDIDAEAGSAFVAIEGGIAEPHLCAHCGKPMARARADENVFLCGNVNCAPPLKERARELVFEVADCPRCGTVNIAIQDALLAFIDEQIAALAAANARVAELERAARFAFGIIDRHHENDSMGVEGDVVQDFATECKVLFEAKMQTPCGEGCQCAEMVGEGEETECFRYTPEMLALRATLQPPTEEPDR